VGFNAAMPRVQRVKSGTRSTHHRGHRYGVELIPENGPQSLIGSAAVPMAVLSDGEFSKSNMSSRVSAN